VCADDKEGAVNMRAVQVSEHIRLCNECAWTCVFLLFLHMCLGLQSVGPDLAGPAAQEGEKKKAITKNNHTAAGNGSAGKDWLLDGCLCVCVCVCVCVHVCVCDSAHSIPPWRVAFRIT